MNRQTKEFLDIETAFKKTQPTANIIKVQRIQNRRLWTVFQTELNFLKEKYGGKEVDVRYLYYGTRVTPPSLIYESEEGFDMRFYAAGMWGRAICFAVTSEYSNNFRFQLPDGNF